MTLTNDVVASYKTKKYWCEIERWCGNDQWCGSVILDWSILMSHWSMMWQHLIELKNVDMALIDDVAASYWYEK